MAKPSYKEIYESICIAILIAVVLLLCFSGGCSQVVSSTDHHNRVPQTNCTQIKYDNSYHTVCCEADKCAIQ